MNKKVFGANILTVLAAHVPCCGPQLLVGVVGAHGVAAFSGGFMHDFEKIAPVIAALLSTAYMLYLLRSEKKKHACCESSEQHNHADHKGHVKDVAIFFFVNLLIGFGISFLIHEFFHDHH